MTERDENGQFKKLSVNEQMNRWMLNELANKPGQRLARRFFDSEARRKQMEEENNGDD
jgi:hypothetical protein